MERTKEKVAEVLSEFISYKFMEEDKDKWMELENDTNGIVPVEYAFYMVEYQNCYFRHVYKIYFDFSVVIYNGGTACGIWPLSIYGNSMEEGLHIGSWGCPLLAPYIQEGKYTIEAKRKLLDKCLTAVETITKEFNLCQPEMQITIMEQGVDVWTQKLYEHDWVSHKMNMECFVDLRKSEDEILSAIRRTNKYSIQKADHLWRHEIINRDSSDEEIANCFRAFRELHIEVAGRETRCLETWNCQEEALRHSKDFVILLYDENDSIIGASLFSTTATWGSYSVAAYKRELFNQPVGHISQWLAIKYMKQMGMEWYHIGPRFYLNDWNHPSDKEISISHFKEGFATNIYSKIYMRMNKDKS